MRLPKPSLFPSSSDRSLLDDPFMKLMLRPEWRLWPLSSFLGFVDLKTGVTVGLLFAVRRPRCHNSNFELRQLISLPQLLNKVAGVYGLIAVLTGAGGSFAQLSLYIYSVVALLALGWGLRAVKNVSTQNSNITRHFSLTDFAGRLEANIILCTPLLRRPRLLYLLDCLLWHCLVALDSSRWRTTSQLTGTASHDQAGERHPRVYSRRTKRGRSVHLAP